MSQNNGKHPRGVGAEPITKTSKRTGAQYEVRYGKTRRQERARARRVRR